MSLQSLLYEMNGLRVKPMTRNEIEKMALPLAKHLKFTKWNKARQRFDDVLKNVATIGNLEILSETEWQELTHNFTKGHFSPSEFTIRIPENTYILACKGDKDSLEIVLHELGHVFLMHQAYLHKADESPTINEDPEWQADTFAEIILEAMGYSITQISLDFGRLEM